MKSAADEESVSSSCAELRSGDKIQAPHHGSLLPCGSVTDIAPEFGLFWIMDTPGGGRKLLNMTEVNLPHHNSRRSWQTWPEPI